jgi:hypothetical protein
MNTNNPTLWYVSITPATSRFPRKITSAIAIPPHSHRPNQHKATPKTTKTTPSRYPPSLRMRSLPLSKAKGGVRGEAPKPERLCATMGLAPSGAFPLSTLVLSEAKGQG